MLFTEIAVRTSRVRLGTGVLNVWGHSSATIAMLATSLHQVSVERSGTPRSTSGNP